MGTRDCPKQALSFKPLRAEIGSELLTKQISHAKPKTLICSHVRSTPTTQSVVVLLSCFEVATHENGYCSSGALCAQDIGLFPKPFGASTGSELLTKQKPCKTQTLIIWRSCSSRPTTAIFFVSDDVQGTMSSGEGIRGLR